MKETVLVTGGAGYVGSHLVPLLVEAGHPVRVLDSDMYDSPSFKSFAALKGCRVQKGDIRHIEDLALAIRGASMVVDLAAIVGDEACEKDRDAAETINLQATELLINLCSRYEVKRLVFASTCSVYGASTGPPLIETSPVCPLSLYAETKLESEKILMSHAEPTEVVVLRLATVFGMSSRMRFDLVLNFFAGRAASGQPLIVYGGDQIRPLVHARDAARAFLWALSAPKAGEIFNVGSNEQNVSIADLGRRVCAAVPGARMDLRPEERDRRDYCVSFDKITSLSGYRTEVSIEQGIRETVQALQTGAIQDYLDDKYYNVKYAYRNA